MGFFANIKAQQAYKLHGQGKWDEALALYEQAMAKGLDHPRYLLSYAVLLIRKGQFQKAKEHLVKIQKHPGMTAEQKVQLFMDYAVCCYKLGDIDRSIDLLEKQHQRQPTGLIYETLGYLYVERLQAESGTMEASQAEEKRQAVLTFLQEAVDYDDEDAICLDNMGQFYYRILGDPSAAKAWFDKAIAIKEGQIDTLWFLSRYDLEQGSTADAIVKLEKALEGRFSPLNYKSQDEVRAEIQRLKKGMEAAV